MPNNFQRMMQIIGEVFDTRNDPEQLQVDQDVIKRLEQIHPATLSEVADENGPAIWILIIPTTAQVMDDFVRGKISEQQLYDRTQPGQTFEAIYLCSATALPEYRGRGEAKKLTLDAIANIRKDHPIRAIYVWPFTKEGDALAEAVARAAGLPLLTRKK